MDFSSFDLSSYAVPSGGIPQAYYIPNFIDEEEEEYLLRQIDNAPIPKWKYLANRRLQTWGGELTTSNRLLSQPMPPFLSKYPDIIGKLRSTGVFINSKHGAPNHVIVNEYLPNQGIMPHEDGPSYHPVVGTISLGSHTLFHYYKYKEAAVSTMESAKNVNMMGSSSEKSGRIIDMSHPVLSILLEPRSLVITTRDLYTDHLHGIDELAEDVFLPAQPNPSDLDSHTGGFPEVTVGFRVANWQMVKDPMMSEVVRNGGTLNRKTRISLTCRDVERIITMKTLR